MNRFLRSALLVVGTAAPALQSASEPAAAPGSRAVAGAGVAQASSPSDQAGIPTPLVFDRSAKLEFADDPSNPVFNFLVQDSGTIDMMICPSSAPPEVLEEGSHQCLVSCADSDTSVHYGVFLLADLDGLGFWNGTDWRRLEHDFEPDVWVHLTVVFVEGWVVFAIDGEPIGVLRARLGRPIDPDDPRGKSSAVCRTYIGGTADGTDGFLGRIGWVRTWLTALSMDDVARLPKLVGPPSDPVLAQCMGACSDFSEQSSGLKVSSADIRGSMAGYARAAKIEAPFFTGTRWVYDLALARERAAKDGQRILAWSTRGDSYHPTSLQLERLLLAEEEWATLTERFVPLLLVATSEDRRPAGVPAGYCGLLDSNGNLLRLLQPWSAQFVLNLDEQLMAAAAAPSPELGEIEALLAQPPSKLTGEQRSRLATLGKKAGTTDEIALRIEHAQEVGEILDLQRRFRRGEPLSLDGAAPLPFEEAEFVYQEAALDLFAKLELSLEPHIVLSDYAVLLWRGLTMSPRAELIPDIADFIIPMRVLDPVVDAVVASTPLVVDLATEEPETPDAPPESDR